ncbi:MAG TPA: hypothetical protein PL151_12040 [Phycisphaerae bacterium]|nr:hypothetical protein [Phycisphaerae bacterium]HOJ72778.1 hypothetical protein [Phycisphaerae bacterium]HOM51795.1 hypothetical protein [Phycisphaerae bacterium]HOQ84373.1 hypothetical protein [Phycisphaerae bacterium]HPP26857.1 hypothetical protein [Phycisphaerae bacterium]
MAQQLARGLRWLTAALMAGTLFQQVTCTTQNNAYGTFPRLVENGVLTSIDFCYIFDCQSGFFGGIVQPCGDPNSTADDLFVDCSATGGGGTDQQQ